MGPRLSLQPLLRRFTYPSLIFTGEGDKKCETLLNDQWLSADWFSFAQVWYRMWSCDSRCTTNVKVSVKGQGHSLKTSSIIAPFWEIWVAKSNGNARIFIESLEVALCVHAQYKIGQKQPRTTGATSGGLSCNELAIATFSSCCCCCRRRRRSFYHYYYC